MSVLSPAVQLHFPRSSPHSVSLLANAFSSPHLLYSGKFLSDPPPWTVSQVSGRSSGRPTSGTCAPQPQQPQLSLMISCTCSLTKQLKINQLCFFFVFFFKSQNIFYLLFQNMEQTKRTFFLLSALTCIYKLCF